MTTTTTRSGGSADGQGTASSSMDGTGAFSAVAHASDSGLTTDANYAYGRAYGYASRTFVFQPGRHTATISFSHLTAHAAATGQGLSTAGVGFEFGCGLCVLDPVMASSGTGDVGSTAVAVHDLSDQAYTETISFTITVAQSLTIGATSTAQAESGRAEPIVADGSEYDDGSGVWVGAHGGTADASISGVVDSITAS